MPPSLKDRINDADKPAGSQKPFQHYRGRGSHRGNSRGFYQNYRWKPYKPTVKEESAVKEEPVESTLSLLSRIEPSPDSLLLRLSPERKRASVPPEDDVEGSAEDQEDVRSGGMEMQVAESSTAGAGMSTNIFPGPTTDSPEPISRLSSESATNRMAEELIASALEHGKQLFAHVAQSSDVPMSDGARSPASEAAVDNMLADDTDEANSTSPLASIHTLPESNESTRHPQPLRTPLSPSSATAIEEAKRLFMPLILQNALARNPNVDVEKIKERALELLTPAECEELVRLANNMRSSAAGPDSRKGAEKVERERGRSKAHGEIESTQHRGPDSPMNTVSDDYPHRASAERSIQSPIDKDGTGLSSHHPGSPTASVSPNKQNSRSNGTFERQTSGESTSYTRTPTPSSKLGRSPPRAPKAMRAALATDGPSSSVSAEASRHSPLAQGNHSGAKVADVLSPPSAVSPSQTPHAERAQEALAGPSVPSDKTAAEASSQATTSSAMAVDTVHTSAPDAPASPKTTEDPPPKADGDTESDVDMDISSDKSVDSPPEAIQNPVEGDCDGSGAVTAGPMMDVDERPSTVEHGASDASFAKAGATSGDDQPGKTSAPQQNPEPEASAASAMASQEGKEQTGPETSLTAVETRQHSTPKKVDDASDTSAPPQSQPEQDKSTRSDEETDIGSSPAEPQAQPSSAEIPPHLSLDAPLAALPVSADGAAINDAPTKPTGDAAAATPADGQPQETVSSTDRPAEAAASVESNAADTSVEDAIPGLNSGENRKRRLSITSSPPQKRRALSQDTEDNAPPKGGVPDEPGMLAEGVDGETKQTGTKELDTKESEKANERPSPMDLGPDHAPSLPSTEKQPEDASVDEVSQPHKPPEDLSISTERTETSALQDKPAEGDVAMDVDKPDTANTDVNQQSPSIPPVVAQGQHEASSASTSSAGNNVAPVSSDVPAQPQPPPSTTVNAEPASRAKPTPQSTTPQSTMPSMPRIYFAQIGGSLLSQVNVPFVVDEETAAAAQRWAKRKTEYDPSQTHIRFSLLCLPTSAVQSVNEKLPPTATPEEMTNALWSVPTKWPPCGRLILTVNPDDACGVWLPEDLDPKDNIGPIDVSRYIKPGENIVNLMMMSNQLDCIYVLHAARPSQEELDGNLSVYRWNRWHDRIRRQ